MKFSARHELVTLFRATPHYLHFLLVTQAGQRRLALPAVAVHHTAGLHIRQNEGFETGRRRVGDVHEPDAADPTAILLCRDRDELFALSLSNRHPLFQTTQVGLVGLNASAQTVTTESDHRPTQLVKLRPRRDVAAQPQNTLQPQSARAIFLAGDIPDRSKPLPKGLARALEDRPRRHRSGTGCIPAGHPLPAKPDVTAARTGKPVQPAQPNYIPDTRPRRKLCFEFFQFRR